MFEWWKPATLARSVPLIGRIAKQFGYKQPDPAKTTEQGSAGSSSPTTYQFTLLAQRYERQQIIEDVRKLLLDDTRAAKANRKTAREAVRKGIVVTVAPREGTPDSVAKDAQEVVDQINAECHVNAKLYGWARMLLAEGDLFRQRVVMGDRIVALKRMPAASMERNTDETDTFPDLQCAFTQFDTSTQETIATFAYWQISHLRWNHIDGERYGESEYVQARGPGRLLQLEEQAQVVRRLTRAAQKRLHHVGTPEHPGSKKDIEDYKAQNGLGNNANAAFDPLQQVLDYFGNGITKVDVLSGDPNVHEIDDLKHFQDVYALGLGAPKAVIGLDGEGINRDVVEDQRAEWLKETVELSSSIGEGLKEDYELGLLLKGINPESVEIKIQFSESNLETPTDRVERVIKLRQATIGTGKNAIPDPLISKQQALALLAEDVNITDPEAEMHAIDAELQEMGVLEQIRNINSPASQDAEPELDSLDSKVFDPSAYKVVVVAVTDPKGRLLVCRRSPGETRAGDWETPGGHVDPGESLEQAALREVKEETGYDVVLGNGMVDFDLPDGSGRGVMVRGHLVGGDLKLKRDEHDDARWIDPREVSKLSPVPPRFALNIRKVLAAPVNALQARGEGPKVARM